MPGSLPRRGRQERTLSFSFRDRLRQLRELRLIRFIHPRLETPLRQRVPEPLTHPRGFVRVVDLIAAEPARDPRLRHALRVANGHAFGLEGEVPRRRRAGVEVLMEPEVR